jgi:hypothetical protein
MRTETLQDHEFAWLKCWKQHSDDPGEYGANGYYPS